MKTIWQINETVGCHVSDPPQSYFKIYVVNCFFGCNVITILNVQIKSRKLCYKQKVLLRSVPTRDKHLLFEIKSNKWVMVEWIRYISFFVKNLWHLFPRKNEFLWGNNIEVKALVFLWDLIKKYLLRSMLDISKACILDFCYIIFEFMLVEKKYIQEGSIVGPCILKLILFSFYYLKSIHKID